MRGPESKQDLKHWLYENHWIISYFLLLVVFVAWASLDALQSWNFLISAVGSILGLSYFALKQHSEEVRLFKELFSSFNDRYDELNERLHALLSSSSDQEFTQDETMLLYDYFNLCAEEYLYYRKGFIYPEVWFAWQNGMKVFYANPRVRALWEKELQTDSYYGFSTACLRGGVSRCEPVPKPFCVGAMVMILPQTATTDREWNFRDDNHQHFFGDIPDDQAVITLTLNWKVDAASPPKLVGRYKIDLGLLVSEQLAKRSNRGVRLRFQRSGDFIEIAIDRQSPTLVIGRKP